MKELEDETDATTPYVGEVFFRQAMDRHVFDPGFARRSADPWPR